MIITSTASDWNLFTWALYNEAAHKTGVEVSFIDTVLPALEEGRVLLATRDDVPHGFIQFMQATLPDTGERVIVERMLYAPRSASGAYLLGALEKVAKSMQCVAILAGSSLHNNEAARRLYERIGFKTNYSFRKEI